MRKIFIPLVMVLSLLLAGCASAAKAQPPATAVPAFATEPLPTPKLPLQTGTDLARVDEQGMVVVEVTTASVPESYRPLPFVSTYNVTWMLAPSTTIPCAEFDASGKIVLVPENEPAGRLHRRFSQGLAAVKKGARIGFMDRAGKLVIPAAYLTAEDFSEGLAAVTIEPARLEEAFMEFYAGDEASEGVRG